MIGDLRALPIAERIRLVEDLWDSIAADQAALPLTDEQRAELDRRLDAYEGNGVTGNGVTREMGEMGSGGNGGKWGQVCSWWEMGSGGKWGQVCS